MHDDRRQAWGQWTRLRQHLLEIAGPSAFGGAPDELEQPALHTLLGNCRELDTLGPDVLLEHPLQRQLMDLGNSRTAHDRLLPSKQASHEIDIARTEDG